MDTPTHTVAASAFSKIEVTSDGTRAGTVIKLNGKEIPNLNYLSFGFWDDDCGYPVTLGFTTSDPDAKPGTLIQTNYFRLIPPSKDDSAEAKTQASVQPSGDMPRDAMPRNVDRRKMYSQI